MIWLWERYSKGCRFVGIVDPAICLEVRESTAIARHIDPWSLVVHEIVRVTSYGLVLPYVGYSWIASTKDYHLICRLVDQEGLISVANANWPISNINQGPFKRYPIAPFPLPFDRGVPPSRSIPVTSQLVTKLPIQTSACLHRTMSSPDDGIVWRLKNLRGNKFPWKLKSISPSLDVEKVTLPPISS